jgi:hypothetical protein
MGVLRLSAVAAAGIHESVHRSPSLPSVLLLVVAAFAGAGACGVRPLTSAELYGAAGAGGAGGGGGGGMAGAAGGAGSTNEDASDAGVDAGPDVPSTGCPQVCDADQFCDELTNRCAPRVGTGMLSGSVIDPCASDGVDARVGIAGQHRCSYVNKGSYFFAGLPFGRLKLAAAKEGYELYGATVEIVPGGVIHDIKLVRTGGCTAPRPTVACTCTDSSCNPQTP